MAYGDGARGKSARELFIQALQMVGNNRRTSMDDLQIQILAGYLPFDPARHNIGAWTADFVRLVPDDASDEQVIRLFERRLPHQYADLLRQAQTESEEHASGWREAVKLFLSRVSGSENRLSKLRKLKSLTQNDGEQIRQFAIRVWDELKQLHGKEPTDQEWRDKVMVGALDATAMELEKIAYQTPGNPGFWEVIKVVEFWERQNAARLNKGDPTSAIRRSSAQGATVLLGDPHVAGREPTVVCTWCSQRGHIEGVCVREPRCARCFGPHPERNHDAVVRAGCAHFPPKTADGKTDTCGARDYAARDSRCQDQSRPSQDAAARDGGKRDKAARAGGHSPGKPDNDGRRKCFLCGRRGHLRRQCLTPKTERDGEGRMQAQALVAMVPHSPAPTSPTKDGSSEGDSEVAKRLKDLEQWRKTLEQSLKR